MRKTLIAAIAVLLLALETAAVAAGDMHPNEKLARENADYLRFSAYVPAREVIEYMGTPEELERSAEILSAAGVTKVFLDVYRGGTVPDRETLERARDFLRKKGFEVSGGITTTKNDEYFTGSQTHRYFICYDNEKSRAGMEKLSRYAASIFDEVIVDDFLATQCRCDECDERRGDRSWPEYFRDVMLGISRKQIVAAAKDENPGVSVIIKYPQWYDRFHMFGYDPGRQPAVFDKVWAGTETRDPLIENVYQYQGYVNYNWVKSLAGEKMGGAWFDQGNTYPEVYLEQAFQSVLAGAPEIVLFGYTHERFTNDNTARLSDNLGYLFRVAKELDGVKRTGVMAYKPVNSDGGSENYVFDFIGMFGVPVLMTAEYPRDARSVLLTEHAAADRDIVKKMRETLSSGGTLLLSAGLIDELKQNEEVLKMAGLLPPGSKTMKGKMATKFVVRGNDVTAGGHVEIGERLRVGSAEVVAAAEIDGSLYPALTVKQFPEGRVVVFNARTFTYFPNTDDLVIPVPVSLINTPSEVVQELRDEATAPLGVQAEMPSRVGLYMFENQYFALDNFNDNPISARVTFDPEITGCRVESLENIHGEDTARPLPGGSFELEILARFMFLYRMKCE